MLSRVTEPYVAGNGSGSGGCAGMKLPLSTNFMRSVSSVVQDLVRDDLFGHHFQVGGIVAQFCHVVGVVGQAAFLNALDQLFRADEFGQTANAPSASRMKQQVNCLVILELQVFHDF